MKVSAVLGSPRTSGNSATITKTLLGVLASKGAQSKTFELNNLVYRGCQGCMSCKIKTEKCIVHDGLTEVLEDIRTSDVTVIASPVYVGEISAQTKGLIDRFYSYYTPDFRTNPKPSRLAGARKLVFILSQGNPDETFFGDIISRYTRLLGRLGFEDIYPLRACGLGPDSNVLNNQKITDRITEIATRLWAAS
jgi:multimeric flavodoxin WrbA